MRTKTLLAAVLTIGSAGLASADVITSVQQRSVTAAEAAGGAPAGGTVIQFFLDSTSDILSINDVSINLTSGSIYNDVLGSDSAPPNPAFIPAFPALGADSFITTPGSTAELSLSVSPTAWTADLGDLTDDGPQSGFLFAQITVSPDAVGTYSFDIAFGAGEAPEEINVSGAIPVPEPSSLALLGLGGLLVARRRRSD